MNKRSVRRYLQRYLETTAQFAKKNDREQYLIEWFELLSEIISDDLLDEIDALDCEVTPLTYSENPEVRQKVREVLDEYRRNKAEER